MKNPKRISVVIAISLVLLIASVSWGGSNVSLRWDANSEADLAGYKLHYGLASGSYGEVVDVGNVTDYTVLNLPDGIYYFVVTAYDNHSNESGFSNEVSTDLDTVAPANPGNLVITIIIKVGN